MNKELSGVFADRETFERLRDASAFDVVQAGEAMTVGVRDPALGVSGRTVTHADGRDHCTIWGEVFVPDDADNPAAWLLDRYAEVGREALEALNGSYVAALEHDGEAFVATDRLRSWECFYAEIDGVRTFGTDAVPLVRRLDDLRSDPVAQLEFLHLGTVLGNRTLFERLHRVPFDGYLTPDGTGEFARVVYDPASFDHVTALSERLERAIARRDDYPGRKGLLLSAGQDSRTLLARIPDVQHCYTIGAPDSQEVIVGRKVAAQYDAGHTTLEPDANYLLTDGDTVGYTQGIRESLHIHHAGYTGELEVDTMYHGLLYDTLFKGYFLERDRIDLPWLPVPRKRLSRDPDPVGHLLDTLGFHPEGSRKLADRDLDTPYEEVTASVDDPRAFLRDRLETQLEDCRSRADSIHNATDLLVLRNQPTMAFRTHLADNYLESFVAADRELIEWHLRTPPEHRHPDTVRKAIRLLDDDIFRHRPPTEPHDSYLLNQVERFLRRWLPFADTFESAWPDRRAVYEKYDLDERLFPDRSEIAELPVRQKLRINDIRWWTPR